MQASHNCYLTSEEIDCECWCELGRDHTHAEWVLLVRDDDYA